MSPAAAESGLLFRLALPVILTQLATMLLGVVDTLMVARLGTATMAAAALGHTWVWGTLMLAMGVLMGLDPIVSQAHGRGDGARCGLALQTALALALVLSIPVALLWTLTAPMLVWAGQDPELAAAAAGYVSAQIPSIPAFLAFTALRQYLAGRAIMTPALWVSWLANGVNVVAAWALIFGHLGFAPRGLVGAGIAAALARISMLVGLLVLVAALRLHRGGWAGWSRAALFPARLREMLALGVPVGVQFGLEVWAFHVSTLLAGWLGPAHLAAHTIALTLASLSFMFPLGVSIAAATRVGNLIGAGDQGRAQRSASIALALGALTMTGFAVLFVLLRHWLPALWRPAPDVALLVATILPIAAAFQVFDGTQVVGCGVLRGMGDTRPAAWSNLIGYYGLALPLGSWLAFRLGWGLPGLWWGLTLGLAAVAGMLAWRVTRHGPGRARPGQLSGSGGHPMMVG